MSRSLYKGPYVNEKILKKIDGKKWRAFSIASTQKEDVILLGTRTGKTPSSFKKALIRLKQKGKN